MDRDKESLISEAKVYVQPKQNKEFARYFPLAGRCFPISRKAGLRHV